QLPPSLGFNYERLEAFIKLVRRTLPRGKQYTFEFRHKSWMTHETYELLEKYNVAFCIYELAGFETPHEVTADYVYIRLHGPDGKYAGEYPNRTLRHWADEI